MESLNRKSRGNVGFNDKPFQNANHPEAPIGYTNQNKLILRSESFNTLMLPKLWESAISCPGQLSLDFWDASRENRCFLCQEMWIRMRMWSWHGALPENDDNVHSKAVRKGRQDTPGLFWLCHWGVRKIWQNKEIITNSWNLSSLC